MSIQELDYYFPFVVMTYGLLVTWLANVKWAQDAMERLPVDLQEQFKGHQGLALVSLLVGSIWSLQNVLLG